MRDFQSAGRSTVHALNGMAATSHPMATLAAIDMLRSGGTAADAAVAAAAMLGVVEPQSTGVGGDAFALYSVNGSEQIIAYNGSGSAPLKATAAWYLDRNITTIPLTGPHSVTVPGAVDMWATLLEQHGRKGIDAALQPAIRVAEEGYAVAPRVAWDWARNREKLRKGVNTEAFFLIDGEAPTIGAVLRQPALANTLRRIALNGSEGFYSGAVADDIVETLRNAGGLHTLDDFRNHKTEITQAVSTSYRNHKICQCPPNGPGVTMLMMLNVLAGFDISLYSPLSTERFHLEAETSRHAFIAREQHVGDPRFANVDVEALLSDAFASGIRSQISLDHICSLPPSAAPMHPSTVYLCVVDRDRNVCSFVNSIAYSFGFGIVGSRSGVLLQNRGAGFRIEPNHPNCIAPGKRPLHTLLATLVTKDGRAILPFGVNGGQFQAVGQVHVLTNIVDYGMDVQTALDLPRAFHYDGLYRLESGVSPLAAAGLEKLGHVVARSEEPLGGGQAIWIDWNGGAFIGGSDPRKDGCALGY